MHNSFHKSQRPLQNHYQNLQNNRAKSLRTRKPTDQKQGKTHKKNNKMKKLTKNTPNPIELWSPHPFRPKTPPQNVQPIIARIRWPPTAESSSLHPVRRRCRRFFTCFFQVFSLRKNIKKGNHMQKTCWFWEVLAIFWGHFLAFTTWWDEFVGLKQILAMFYRSTRHGKPFEKFKGEDCFQA